MDHKYADVIDLEAAQRYLLTGSTEVGRTDPAADAQGVDPGRAEPGGVGGTEAADSPAGGAIAVPAR
jgi:hypothetical protein